MSTYKPEREFNIRVFREHLPAGAHGMAAPDNDGYMIVVNADESPDKQAETFLHEMLHIWNDDFNDPVGNVQVIEARTHRQLRRLLELSLKE